MKLEAIKPMHLLKHFENLQEEGIKHGGGKLAPATINMHYTAVRSLFSKAVEWGLLPTNPVQSLKPLKISTQAGNVYDKEQVAALLKAAHQEGIQKETLIHLAVMTGLRLGELHELEWKDVNLEEKTLEVRQIAQYVNNIGIIFKEPKTASSKRIIHLSDMTVNLLKEYRKHWLKTRLQFGDMWQLDRDILFFGVDGKAMRPTSTSGWFNRFLKRHNLPHIRFHDLRHTSATLLLSYNQSMKIVSSRLGHSKIGTTLDIYGHVLKNADQEAADVLANALQDNDANQKITGK